MIYVVAYTLSYFDFHILIIVACIYILITKKTYNFKLFIAFIVINIIWSNAYYGQFGIPMSIASIINLAVIIRGYCKTHF